MCEAVRPDLLIVDRGLPDGDGLELLRSLRHLGIPAILMSGEISSEVSADVKALGFEPAEKPIATKRLLDLVYHLIRPAQQAGG